MLSTIQTGGIALAILAVVVVSLGAFLAKSFEVSPYFPRWVAVWFVISSFICMWDALYILNRENPAVDSRNNIIWAPYKDYVKVDYLYRDDSDFVWSQSILNLFEISLNLISLYLLSSKKFKQAAAVALVVSAMTSSKTILYHVMEISCHGCNSKQNDWATFLTLYILPNGVWIWVPMYVCIVLGSALSAEDNEAVQEGDDSVRGTCVICNEAVLTSHPRGKDHAGRWYHLNCFEDQQHNLQEEPQPEEENEEEVVEEEVLKKQKKKTRAKSKSRTKKSSSKKSSKKSKPTATKSNKTSESNKASGKYIRTTTLVANLRDPDADQDISMALRPRSRRSTRLNQ
jgi:hypothetical protein